MFQEYDHVSYSSWKATQQTHVYGSSTKYKHFSYKRIMSFEKQKVYEN